MNGQAGSGTGRHDRPWVLLAVTLLGLFAMAPGPRQLLALYESRFTDLLFVSVQRPASEHPVAVVAKDQLFIDQFGREPGRADMARTLDTVVEAGGKVAALDYIYDLPRSAEEDAAFASALGRFPAPVLAQHFVGRQGLSGAEAVQISDENAERPSPPLPLLETFARHAADRGLINQLPDPDGTIRTMPLAFLPAEAAAFLPTLGFAAWIQAGLAAAAPDPAIIASGFPDPVTASEAARAAFRRLWEAAPHPFPGFGHEGLDAIVRRREARMLGRRLSARPGVSPVTAGAWGDIAETIDITGLAGRGWLPFPGGRPPLTGSRHLPCLRIPFAKPTGSLKGDGIPVISMGVLLASAPPDSLGSIDIGERLTDTRFIWAATGTASISGIATDLYGRPLAGIGVLARQTDGAAWASGTTGPEGRFTVGALPAGSYRATLTLSRPQLTVRLSSAEPLLVGTGSRELPPARFPPTDSTLGGTLAPATQPLQLVVEGEALPVGTTDDTGRLPLKKIPSDIYLAVVEGDEAPGWATGSSPVVTLAGAPLSGRKVALLESESAWNARFTARLDIPVGAASFTFPSLPSTLDARVLLLGDADTDGELHTTATELLLDTTTLLRAAPPVTPVRLRRIAFDKAGFVGNGASDAWLVGDDGSWHRLGMNGPRLELPAGRYLLLGHDAQGRNGRADRIATAIAGRTLFFGTILLEDQDFVTTPINLLETRFRKLPGVHLHANLCSALSRGAFLWPTPFHPDAAPDAWPLLNLLLLAPFLAFADHLFQGGRGISAVTVLGLTIIAWLSASAGLFARNMLFPAAFPVSLTVLFGIARGAQAYFTARTRERETRATFGRFIAAPMVEQILRHPDAVRPGGEKKELTVMFTDLAGFTSISEMMTPEELTKLMNEYLGEMTRVLFEHGGTLDKYIGDALMGFWNHPAAQPDHALRAARCAIAMQRRLAVLRDEWLKRGLPRVEMRAGINTSECMVGFIGSDIQMNFTCLGDGVNLASRLEGANKAYHTLMMVSETTHRQLGGSGIRSRLLDFLAVKGKAQPVKVFELIGVEGEEDALWNALLPVYDEGMQRYLARAWDEAEAAFRKVLALRPDDGPAAVYLERIGHFRVEPPPEGWDGRYILKTK